MSKYIPNIEIFDFSKAPEKNYCDKIEKIVKRYKVFEADNRFREVEPPDPNRRETYFSIKFVSANTEIYCVYQERDLYVVAVIAKGVLYALSGSNLNPKDFDDVGFGKLHLGLQYDQLADRQTINITKSTICDSIKTLDRGYNMPTKKLNAEWGSAIALLIMITSESARFHPMKEFVQIGLEKSEYTQYEPHMLDRRLLVLQNNWDRISKTVRSGKYPFKLSYMEEEELVEELVTRDVAGEMIAILNHKDGNGNRTHNEKESENEGKGREKKGKDRKKGKKQLKNLLEVAILYLFRIRSLPAFVKWWGQENTNQAQKLLFTRHISATTTSAPKLQGLSKLKMFTTTTFYTWVRRHQVSIIVKDLCCSNQFAILKENGSRVNYLARASYILAERYKFAIPKVKGSLVNYLARSSSILDGYKGRCGFDHFEISKEKGNNYLARVFFMWAADSLKPKVDKIKLEPNRCSESKYNSIFKGPCGLYLSEISKEITTKLTAMKMLKSLILGKRS